MDFHTLSMLATRLSFQEIVGMVLLQKFLDRFVDWLWHLRWRRRFSRRITVEPFKHAPDNGSRNIVLYRAILQRIQPHLASVKTCDTVLVNPDSVMFGNVFREQRGVSREFNDLVVLRIPAPGTWVTVGDVRVAVGNRTRFTKYDEIQKDFVDVEANSNKAIDDFIDACWSDVRDVNTRGDIKALIHDKDRVFVEVVVNPLPFDEVFFPQKESFIKTIRRFDASREPCVVLLTGKPGVGKTSIIKATATLLQRNLVPVPVNDLGDKGFLRFVNATSFNEKILPMHRLIFVLEDVDALTDAVLDRGRPQDASPAPTTVIVNEKPSDKEKLTLSGMLNALDGIVHAQGQMIILTTNHPDKLDPALVRPGRVDIRLDLPDKLSDANAIWRSKLPDTDPPDHESPAHFFQMLRTAIA